MAFRKPRCALGRPQRDRKPAARRRRTKLDWCRGFEPLESRLVFSASNVSAVAVAVNALENQGFTQAVAVISDPSQSTTTSDYTATIDWGDGTTTPATISTTIDPGVFAVDGSHKYAEEGSYTIDTTIDEDGVPTLLTTGTAQVSDLQVAATGGVRVTTTESGTVSQAALATFVDPAGVEGSGDYSAVINWGDGTSSAGDISASVAGGTVRFTVAGTHTYSDDGLFNVSVTVHHDTAPDATVFDQAVVADVPVVAQGGFSIAATESALSSSQTLATFSDPAGPEPTANYQATILWGDGQSSTGSIAFNPGENNFTVSGQHSYAEEGVYGVAVTIHHGLATPDATLADTANVADPAVEVTGVGTFALSESTFFAPQTLASFTDPGGNESLGDYTATVDWGDGSVSTGSIVYNPATQQFDVVGNHFYITAGTQTVTVTIHHDTAPAASAASTAVVSLATINPTSTGFTWRELVSTATVPLATFTYGNNVEPADSFAATINWGDGTTSAGTVAGGPSLGYTVTGAHTYADSGTFPLQITLAHEGVQTTLASTARIIRELLPAPFGANGSPNQYYVAEMYTDILDRQVDSIGLLYWTSLLNDGVPHSAIADGLLLSPEYLGNFVVQPAYRQFLGRDADPQGLQYWIGRLQHGLTDEQLRAAFLASPEFFDSSGGTNESWVEAMYSIVLSRSADPAGLQFWLGQLKAGASRVSVALGFVTSNEDQVGLIESDYRRLLARDASFLEVEQWVSALDSGQTDEDVIAGIVSSDEYFNHAQTE